MVVFELLGPFCHKEFIRQECLSKMCSRLTKVQRDNDIASF